MLFVQLVPCSRGFLYFGAFSSFADDRYDIYRGHNSSCIVLEHHEYISVDRMNGSNETDSGSLDVSVNHRATQGIKPLTPAAFLFLTH